MSSQVTRSFSLLVSDTAGTSCLNTVNYRNPVNRTENSHKTMFLNLAFKCIIGIGAMFLHEYKHVLQSKQLYM